MEGKAGFSYAQVQVIDGELMLISYAERFRAAAEILGMQILSIDGLVIISYKHCRTGLLKCNIWGGFRCLFGPLCVQTHQRYHRRPEQWVLAFSMLQSLVPASGRKDVSVAVQLGLRQCREHLGFVR